MTHLHGIRAASYLSIALAALVVALAVNFTDANLAGAQFTPPSSAPPSGGPTVIHSIGLAATPQTASINVTGGIRTNGCMGSTFAGYTGVVASMALANGYKSADTLCNTAVAGSHVCRVEEVMESLKCSAPLTAGQGWVNGGPPGYTANANDCGGWTSNSATYYGRVWVFDGGTTGGSGTMTTCSASTLPFACCK